MEAGMMAAPTPDGRPVCRVGQVDNCAAEVKRRANVCLPLGINNHEHEGEVGTSTRPRPRGVNHRPDRCPRSSTIDALDVDTSFLPHNAVHHAGPDDTAKRVARKQPSPLLEHVCIAEPTVPHGDNAARRVPLRRGEGQPKAAAPLQRLQPVVQPVVE